MTRVHASDRYTDAFGVYSGVGQGCVMSPTQFFIYIINLAEEINGLNCGIDHVDIDGLVLSTLLYGDDIAVIAGEELSLQQMLDCVDSLCERW